MAKIVEILDARGASFVSVTQAFNTTTSMGRLTLNVLLSFAQFEREVTGERIRDKIAASKKKGMWMGGSVPMGYEVKERKLVVHEAEAETVRFIYKRYIELGTVPALIDDLGRRNIRTKVQVRTSGPHRGGIPFARGSLYHLLRNRIYLGEIVHKGVAYPGEHQPIVPVDLWQAVQARLAGNATRRRHGSGAEHPSLFVGLLHDGLGRRMSPAHANKQSKRYRYYVTHEQARGGEPAWRVPAHDLERLVIDRLQRFLGDEAALHQLVQPNSAAKAQQLLATARRSFDALGAEPDNRIAAIRQLVDRIDLHDDRIDIHVKCAALDVERSTNHLLSLAVKRMRRGHDIRLVIAAPNAIPAQRDEKLVALIAEAHAARRSVFAQTGSLAEIASRLGQCRGRLADRVRLSYLAPDIVTAIVEGRQPSSLDRRKLLATKLSPDWSVQRIQLGFE